MIELLRKALDLLLRFLDWRKGTKRERHRDQARKAIATHDRQAMNELLMERMNRRD
ncbi:MAG TPA: hypothetical protein IAC79_05450 [Candidatus Spyradenecus faecavium]|uniref:Uncharacterized protein n=1 Tax=Candidatus Spyradenecus faecavium TaxID=2840947 RepID=A0A9D1T3B5_9BACT|nr:hypothetical protein [Candidatus Spyradenecus faecavium]